MNECPEKAIPFKIHEKSIMKDSFYISFVSDSNIFTNDKMSVFDTEEV